MPLAALRLGTMILVQPYILGRWQIDPCLVASSKHEKTDRIQYDRQRSTSLIETIKDHRVLTNPTVVFTAEFNRSSGQRLVYD